ncbi:MAG TPA: F0F1 ATP synthase subunit B [Candidatus Dormibacteraeota bacterium]|nr:F0F1 ATP synthase subunit B [Candidatus Dormibacteraeota bacterium]
MHAALFLDAGPLTINGTFIVEVIAFVLMVIFLAKVPLPFLGIPKPVYPWIISIAEARQRAITEELEEAAKARTEADERLKEADAKLADARRTAESVIDGANRSGEQLRQELREKAEAEYQRIVASAQTDIAAERERALASARDEVAGLVVAATQKVIGETLDDRKHHQLIERAIEEVASGDGRG